MQLACRPYKTRRRVTGAVMGGRRFERAETGGFLRSGERATDMGVNTLFWAVLSLCRDITKHISRVWAAYLVLGDLGRFYLPRWVPAMYDKVVPSIDTAMLHNHQRG